MNIGAQFYPVVFDATQASHKFFSTNLVAPIPNSTNTKEFVPNAAAAAGGKAPGARVRPGKRERSFV